MKKSDTKTTIGFIGIGTMGVPMVRCLHQAGYSLILHDINYAAAAALATEVGAAQAKTLEEIAKACDVIILMLPNSAVVSSVIGSAKGDGLAPHLKLGAIIVDMSSSDPMETRKLGESLQAQGSTLLDAPVSGGLRKAVAGTLSILLGGDNTEALEKVFPILSAMGTVLRTGGLGSGHATKALNNYVSAAGLAAACEAVIVGREFGLDPDILVDAINASTGRNNSTENKLKQFVLNEEFATAGFALDLMAKDVALAASLADAMGKALPGLTAARSLWAEAKSELGAGTDHTEIYRHLVKKAESNAS